MRESFGSREHNLKVSIREIVGASIALVTILAFLFIIIYDVVNNKNVTLPDALLVLVSLVSGVYLGQHAATNGAYVAGAQAAQAVANVAAATVAANAAKNP
jgi:hypothetical protein